MRSNVFSRHYLFAAARRWIARPHPGPLLQEREKKRETVHEHNAPQEVVGVSCGAGRRRKEGSAGNRTTQELARMMRATSPYRKEVTHNHGLSLASTSSARIPAMKTVLCREV